jgi:hypothetical protein
MEGVGRKQDAARSFLQKKVEEGRRKMKKEAAAREEADKALRLSQMVRSSSMPRDVETGSSASTDVVTPLGRPNPFALGGGASGRGGLLAEIGAGVQLKRSKKADEGETKKKNPLLAGIEGGRAGLKKTNPLSGKKTATNPPMFSVRNPLLDNPMARLRQRMAAEDDDSGF